MQRSRYENSVGEQWLPIGGYEGLYEVSDLGCVRSLHARFSEPRPCKFGTDQTGYPTVMLSKDGKRTPYTVHRLVALAFHGDKRNALHCEVAHLDNDMKNPRADNLKWVSRVENESHKVKNGTRRSDLYSKYTEEQVRQVRELSVRHSYREISETLGISQRTVEHLARGRSWRHVPCPEPGERVSRNFCLTPEQAHNLKERYQNGERCVELASEFGVSRATAYRAIAGQAAIASGTVIRPMFTHRVHKAPVPRGHRQWLEVRG